MNSTTYVTKTDGYTVTVTDAHFEMNENGELENVVEPGAWMVIEEQDGKIVDREIRFSWQAAERYAKRLIAQ